MIFISKKTRRIYFFVLIPMAVITSLIALFCNNWMLFYIDMLLMIALVFVISTMAAEEIRGVNLKLSIDLNTEEYLNYFEDATKLKNKEAKVLAKSYLLIGYVSKGDFEKAKQLFYELNNSLALIKNPQVKILPLSACANYLLLTNQPDVVNGYLAALSGCHAFSKKQQDAHQKLFNMHRLEYLCATNQLKDITEIEYMFNKTKSNLNKLELKFFLGNYYEMNNDFSSAIEQYNYVVENGKDLYIAQVSKSKLK